MRSLFTNKLWVVLISILALGALTVLAVSLQDIAFDEAQLIGHEEMPPFAGGAQALPNPFTNVTLQSQIILWLALLTLVALVAVLLSPEARKRMLKILVRVFFAYWVFYYLFNRYPDLLSKFDLTGGAPAVGEAETVVDIPPPVFTPPQQTPLMLYAISLLVILILMFLAWKFYRLWQGLNPSARHKPLSEIAKIARSSLKDLASGGDSTDVIMRCYFRMSDVVSEKRNMERGLSMTPAEFASRLERSGLPGDAVRRLTRLFEGVRYGAHKAGPREINEAVACLTTILQYCGEPV
jgi:hypothetical protein